MQRSILIMGLALASTSALAADLPRKAPPVPYTSAAPVSNWTGFYVGAVGGYAVSRDDATISPLNANAKAVSDLGLVPAGQRLSAAGAFGGGTVGYNYQFAPLWLAGIEADFAGGSIRGSDQARFAIGPASLTTASKTDMSWLSTVRGRIGFTGFDRSLIYATGGLAMADVKTSTAISLAGVGPLSTTALGTASGVKTGWTAGLGYEYALLPKWTVKAEWLHVDLGGHSTTQAATVGGFPVAWNAKNDLTFETFRVGVNYQLNGL